MRISVMRIDNGLLVASAEDVPKRQDRASESGH